jgi:hypothetical protein
MRVIEPAEGFLLRVDDVADRLESLARVDPAPPGLTDPDQPSGERWDWGQVWAHLGEFVPYWITQIRGVLALDRSEPPPFFGRTKGDTIRVDTIERDRHLPTTELMERLRGRLRDLRVLLGDMGADDWDRTVAHPTLGEMGMERVFEAFLVGHLEQHAAQLDGLVAGAGPSA